MTNHTKLRIARISPDFFTQAANLLGVPAADLESAPHVAVTTDAETGTEFITRNGHDLRETKELPTGSLLYLDDSTPAAMPVPTLEAATALSQLLNGAWYRAYSKAKRETTRAWGKDIESIATFAMESAEAHNWCEEYDEAVDELNNMITHPHARFEHRERSWEVTLTVSIVVNSQSESEAGDEASDQVTGALSVEDCSVDSVTLI